jgi:hypothetical protein
MSMALWAVGLEDAHCSGGGDAMRVQEDHDAADHLLVGPAGGDLSGADFTDAGNFAKTFGGLLDDVEHRRTEGFHQLAGIDRADSLDHA